jgi:hypothetical protein
MTAPAGAGSPALSMSQGRGTAELVAIADLGEEARMLLAPGSALPTQRAYVALLMERGFPMDAVRFIAHALPRREAVWWSWVCARKSAGETPKPQIKAALDATERWVVQPTEDHRRQALQFGEAADFGTAAGCAALGAFMSGGSLGPPEAPVVPPGEFMTAKAVSGSVILAAVTPDPVKAAEKFEEYVKLGLEVADRTKLWPAT